MDALLLPSRPPAAPNLFACTPKTLTTAGDTPLLLLHRRSFRAVSPAPSSQFLGIRCGGAAVPATPDQESESAKLAQAHMTSGQSDNPRKQEIDEFISALRKVWDNFPQPVRSFPWKKVLINFCHLILELTWQVAKYLSVPLLAVTSLSEMSYCAHERKMGFIPFPFFVGLFVAGILKDTAIELYPDIEEERFPGHLLVIAILFLLLKLPGPHYPYWGRLIIPHFANGGLWRTIWSAFMWYKVSQGTSGSILGSVADSPYQN